MPAPTKPAMSPTVSGLNLPGKRSPVPPQARQAPPQTVETTKLDPAELGLGMVQKSKEQELLENAEPIFSPPPQPSQVKKKPAQQPPAVSPIREPEKDALTTLVSTKLVDQLAREYGFDPIGLHAIDLKFKNKVLKVEFRAPTYDDYLWSLALLQRGLETDDSYLQTDVQRQQFYTSIVSSRCVQKVNGQWLWDLFEIKDQIEAVAPMWRAESFVGVPDFMTGTMAKMTLDLFRTKLHYQFLYDLTDAIQALEREDKKQEESTEERSENPT